MYVLNATDGAKISFFATASNSWSSPTLYEGKAYVGNNDWNVYCFAENPLLDTNIEVELTISKISLGEVVSGSGLLVPGKEDASVTLFFVKPDGTVNEQQVATVRGGAFGFTYTPNVAGNWSVAAQWQSDESYYTSAFSLHVPFEVVNPQSQDSSGGGVEFAGGYIYSAVAVAIVTVVVVAGTVVVLRMKRKRTER